MRFNVHMTTTENPETATTDEAAEATLRNAHPFLQAAVLRVVLDNFTVEDAARRFGLTDGERDLLPELVETARRMGVALARRHGTQA